MVPCPVLFYSSPSFDWNWNTILIFFLLLYLKNIHACKKSTLSTQDSMSLAMEQADQGNYAER